MKEDFKTLIEYVLILWKGGNIDDEEFEDLIRRNGYEINSNCEVVELGDKEDGSKSS